MYRSRDVLGLASIFEQFEKELHGSKKTNYPPYNVLVDDDDDTIITLEMALAGFKRDEIEVEIKPSDLGKILTVSGQCLKGEANTTRYITKQIGTREFKSNFELARYYELESAVFEDGILSIILRKIIPDEERSVKVKIG